MERSNVTPLHRGIVLHKSEDSTPAALPPWSSASRAARTPARIPKGTAPLLGFANYSARELAKVCGVSLATAQKWRKVGRAPATIMILLQLYRDADLGALSPIWDGWRLRDGKLVNRDGHEYAPGEVWAIGLQQQRIASLEATIRELRAAAELAECFRSERERSRRESEAIGKAEALCRVVFALLRELTDSEGGYPPALDSSSGLVRRLQVATCQVAIELYRGKVATPAESEAAIAAALAEFETPSDDTDRG